MEQKPVTLTTVLITSALTCIVLGALLFVVRKEMTEQYAIASAERKEAYDSLTKKINALESQTSELAGRPTTDTATIDNLKGELTSAKTTIGELNDRITQMEKKAEEPPPPPTNNAIYNALKSAVVTGANYEAELDIWDKAHPNTTGKTAKLRAHTDGVATEEKLRTELRETVNKVTSGEATFPDGSLVSRINTHLSGLISIKKQSSIAPELQSLRDSIGSDSLDSLKTKVGALPEAQKASFSDWLAAAQTRSDVVAELNALGNTL